MSNRSIKRALASTLEDLTYNDFAKFCYMLVDRREEPRIRRHRVENKYYLDVVDVMVSTFTESGALQVAVDILAQIDCNAEAERLGEKKFYVRTRRYVSHELRSTKSQQTENQRDKWLITSQFNRKLLMCRHACSRPGNEHVL